MIIYLIIGVISGVYSLYILHLTKESQPISEFGMLGVSILVVFIWPVFIAYLLWARRVL